MITARLEHGRVMTMPDREKVIGGLAACTGETNDCAGHTCPYWDFDDSVVDHGCRIQMELDALALVKKQQEQIDRLIEENASNAEMAEGLKELLKEQQHKIWELTEINEYLDDVKKDQEHQIDVLKEQFDKDIIVLIKLFFQYINLMN